VFGTRRGNDAFENYKGEKQETSNWILGDKARYTGIPLESSLPYSWSASTDE